ncbi:serine/threonine protein kinase [Mesobacillus campisalis]|uniref:Serine/threonine protein kinase n=1 Tax=Mesobacillus campisalis TaxID=1408103 RepID=A0A0M2SFZ3_9BACI|nr:protein kinase [Mesobacillus campisalis]KKK33649.1 serine/threonine protein kinase [Mesobacillus campisalis]
MYKQLKKWIYDRPLKDGTVFPPGYKIEECFGGGGYGIVYLCKDIHSQELFALKQLRPSKAGNVKEIARFQQEVELVAKIGHKRVPGLIHHSTFDGRPFYVMQHIEGSNLEDKLFSEGQTFTERESLMILSELAAIVEYLHGQNIFHGDIRPPNIIIENEEVFLIDFGLAKVGDPESWEELQARRQDDFFDLGETLLFLLYSQFEGKASKRKSWLEELTMSDESRRLIKRLLGIDACYEDTESIRKDINLALGIVKP